MQRTIYLTITLFAGIATVLWLNNGTSLPGTANATEATATYEILTVSKHANAKDCWIVVRDTVYDVSTYIPIHPTSPELISRYCGKDATQAFETKDKSRPRNHSSYAWELLENYRIGKLKP